MCDKCGYENGTTRHLLYWQAEWFKRFLTTWYHIVNRKAYWKWCEKNCSTYKKRRIPKLVLDIDEGLRIELDEVLRDKHE